MRLTMVAVGLALLAVQSSGPAGAGILSRGSGQQQCIPRHAIRASSAPFGDEIAFHMNGSRVFVNHLPSPCEGIRDINTTSKLRLPAGERLCEGDKVEIVGSSLMGSLGLGKRDGETVRCTLGKFEPSQESLISESYQR